MFRFNLYIMAVIILKCNRCMGEWPQKGEKEPKTCAKCNSPYWNKKRVYKTREEGVLPEVFHKKIAKKAVKEAYA